ncbi:MAG: heparinase II/III family protein, partial [Spirochaetia bacterium]|nr:heparinase II/III family protein [Spirochaetia bacterium]
LHRGVGVNLFERPFWKNNIRWRMQTAPFYSKKILSFGDGSSPMRGLWRMTADMVRLIAHSTKTSEFDAYLGELEAEIPKTQSGVEDLWYFRKVSPLQYFCGEKTVVQKAKIKASHQDNALTLFPEGGWAAIRTAPHDPENDIAFIFRSSPYGNDSHSHANQNDFILHAGGEALLHPSGYYDGWGTHHQTSWVWHSRSHNCLTLSGASQLLRSRAARGAVLGAFENERLVYFLGNADRAYANQARKCRRHVLFFKNEKVFLLLDEVAAKPGQSFQCQWNAHSFEKFKVGPDHKMFSVRKNKVVLDGHFLYRETSFVNQSEGFEPPYHTVLEENLKFWGNQHHLQFVASTYASERRIGVLLAPRFGSHAAPEIKTSAEGSVECASFSDIGIRLRQGERLASKDPRPEGEPFLEIQIGENHLKINSDGICSGVS